MLVGIGSGLVLLLLILLALAIGYSFNKHWIRAGTPKPNAAANRAGIGVCGRCGYPARGITTFECPECGADLREAGIVRPGQGGGGTGSLIAVALIYTVAFMIAGAVLYEFIESQLPTYGRSTGHLRLQPASRAYDVDLEVASREVIYNKHPSVSGLNLNGSAAGYRVTANTPLTVSLQSLGPNAEITGLSMEITPSKPPAGAWSRPEFTVSPDDRSAAWTDLAGNLHNTSGPMTDQDVLRFLGDAGLDVTNQQNIDNAREFFDLLDGIPRGLNQFTLTGFDSRGGGSSVSSGSGPKWVGPVYSLACIVLWALGLTWIARRLNGTGKAPNKHPKKY